MGRKAGFLTLVVMLLAATTLLADPGHGRSRYKGNGVFVRGPYQNLPPGLAKRNGELPPGLQRHIDRTGHLPPGLEKRFHGNRMYYPGGVYTPYIYNPYYYSPYYRSDTRVYRDRWHWYGYNDRFRDRDRDGRDDREELREFRRHQREELRDFRRRHHD